MRVQVQKWGNSLALRISRFVAAETKIEQGSSVEISLINGAIVLKPIQSKTDLASLLGAINEDNIHGEMDSGEAVGREAW